jgi:regulator of sigma E protease
MIDWLLNDSFLSAILAFAIVLVPLILVHELGHFLAAKAVGITILEFGLGFPPRIRKLFTWQGTEFTLNWIPLGGFVRPLGEDMIRPVDDETLEQDRQELLNRTNSTDPNGQVQILKSVNEARPLQRIFFMAAGALANFLVAWVIFSVVAMSGIVRPTGTGIGVVNINSDSTLRTVDLNKGDIIVAVNGVSFADTQEFFSLYRGEESDGDITFTVRRGDEVVDVSAPSNQDAAPLALENYVQLLGIAPNSPAMLAGLLPGDIITEFNGSSVSGVLNLRELTTSNLGQEVTLAFLRDDAYSTVQLVPRENPPPGEGAIGIQIGDVLMEPSIGFVFSELIMPEVIQLGFFEAIQYGVDRVIEVIRLTVQLPGQLIRGETAIEDARPVSVVGMSQIGAVIFRESVDQGSAAPILEFIAMISVALAFFNLLPIPALDGGRILFVLVEIIRGRPIAPEREGVVHLVGLVVLLSLSILIMLNDVINPVLDSLR